MSLGDKIPEIESLIKKFIEKNPDSVQDLRLLLITPNQWLRVYGGRIEKYQSAEELYFVRGLTRDRGDMLDFFAKLEFLVNELIQARFLGLFSEKAYEFDDLLEKIDFEQKIRLLKKWGIINNNLLGKIQHIFTVRNQLAHRWDEKEVFYGKKDASGNKLPLTEAENFNKFKADGESVWVEVVKIFMVEEEKGIERLVVKLDDPNTISVWADITKQRETEYSE
jgi:hypothetical protein